MKRSIFPVATITVAILAVLGLGLSRLRPLIPNLAASNNPTSERNFVTNGYAQSIQWNEDVSEALAKSRRLDRPVLLFMGTAWNRSGRKFDEVVFRDNDVQSYLERHFVCLRLDLDDNPQYLSAFAPISRVETGGVSTIQIIFLMPTGESFRFFFPRASNADATAFLIELVASFSQFSEIRETPEKLPNSQTQERGLCFTGSVQPRGYETYYAALRGGINRAAGGFTGGSPTCRTFAWRSFLLMGDHADFHDACREALTRGLVDWLDGGFFGTASDLDFAHIEFDKPAELNAEIMLTLAMASKITPEPLYELTSKATFDWLVSSTNSVGQVPTARIGEENRFDRDQRSSFYAKDFRKLWSTGLVSPSQASYATSRMGLDSRTNPSMVVRIASSTVLTDDTFFTVLAALRKAKEPKKLSFTEVPTASVNGAVTAALIQSARLWGDQARLESALKVFYGLDRFRSQSEISRTELFSHSTGRFLGDYLAYADAAMAAYSATGNDALLDAGAAVLKRARSLFASGTAGVWTPMVAPYDGQLIAVDSPDIYDCQGESLTARMVRVIARYSRLVDGNFREEAEAAKAHFSGIIPVTRRLGAGIFNAVAELEDDTFVLTAGTERVAMANRLSGKLPVRFVVPKPSNRFGDLKPGAYIVSHGNVQGPFTEPQLILRISPRFSIP